MAGSFDEGWDSPRSILVILAHPDDPEFFCGATLARWIRMGHRVRYCLLTRGDKGTNDPSVSTEALALRREDEQRAAASVLGVEGVRFLHYPDGYLVPSLETRRDVVRVIRQERPDILVTCDPTNLFVNEMHINHPDHRAAGQIVVDALFPAAGNPMYFPELMHEEGLMPHAVQELWLSGTPQPNVILDVTDLWDTKVRALHEHRSQIGDIQAFDQRMYHRHTADSTFENPRFEERLRRLVFEVRHG